MIVVEAAAEITEKRSKGAAMPRPKNMKLIIFTIKLAAEVAMVFVNIIAINAGLHGRTIAPNKNPYTNALRYELERIGA